MLRVRGHRLLICLAMFGCAPTASPPGAAGVASAALGSDGYISHQGRLLLGFVAPDVRRFVFPVSLGRVRVTSDGELVGDAAGGTALKGLKVVSIAGSSRWTLRIAAVTRPASAGERWRYTLEQWDAASGTWEAACADPPQLDGSTIGGKVPALAMSGWWRADGMYIDDPTAVSFACVSGVAGKCVGWGYAPSDVPPATTEHGVPSSASGADLLLSCTRMARADYCSVGVPNTFDGTPIHVHDVFGGGPSAGADPVPGFAFEATWPARAGTPNGAPSAPAALCLSKLRWSTLPLSGDCPLALPDPRVEVKARFCEDYKPEELERLGALVMDDSSYLDAGLYTWSDSARASELTTTALVPGRVGTAPTWRGAPIAGLPLPPAGTPMRLEGTVFAPGLTLPGLTEGLVRLASFRCGDDYVTTAVDLSSACVRLGDEGLVYPPNTPARSKLRRWWSPARARSLTTTASPVELVDDGWQLVDVEGGVVRAELAVNVRWDRLAGASYSLDVQTRAGEWIAPCVGAARIGAAVATKIDGSCPDAYGRVIHSGDIAAFRLEWTTSAGAHGSAVVPYDGVETEVYLSLPSGTPTALALSWPDQGRRVSYAVDVLAAGSWRRCAGRHYVANDDELLLHDRCPEDGAALALATVSAVRVCATPDGATPVCATAPWDHRAASLRLPLPDAP